MEHNGSQNAKAQAREEALYPNKKKTERVYNILYVGNFSKNSVGEPEIARAFTKVGHNVKILEEFSTGFEKIKTEVNRGIYDFLLFAKFRVAPTPEIIKFFREMKIPKVCWLFDLYWGQGREILLTSREIPMCYSTIAFTTDGGHERLFKRMRVNHRILRQGIEEGNKIGKPIYPTKAEIGFVGTINRGRPRLYRNQLINFLKETYGLRFEHFGQGGDIRHEALNNLLATLKIVVGDSANSPFYWSNRIYETVGRGGFLIHPKILGLDKEFKYYKHFIPYSYGDFKGLKEKIDYYLTRPRERDAVRWEGYKYCHENHTYTDRVVELINILRNENIIH